MKTKTIKNNDVATGSRYENTVRLGFLHIAPRKVRYVADTIRGLTANEAEAQLLLRVERPARPLLKLLRSGIANAKSRGSVNLDSLFVSRIQVDQGPMLKRSLPRAQGRATPIHKKMSHVIITLAERPSGAPPRFVIAPPIKKEKKNKASAGTKPPKTKDEQARPEERKGRSGFFKRIFQRKAV